MEDTYQKKTESKSVTAEDKSWQTPLPPNEQKTLVYIRINRLRRWLYKRSGFAGKTIWDFIQLLGVIAIPIVVVVASNAFGSQLNQVNLRVSEQQYQTNIQIATNQQEDATLATYLDTMTNLMLNNSLLHSKPGDEVRIIARVQSLTALKRLDPTRKDIVLHFLYESGLLSIISLDDANLSGIHDINLRPLGAVDLKGLMLQYADLTHTYFGNLRIVQSSLYYTDMSFSTFIHMMATSSNFNDTTLSHTTISDSDLSNSRFIGADLSNANLSNVILRNVDLSNANLNGAVLNNVDLRGAKVTSGQLALAKSLKGTIMPDGSIHP